MKIILFAILLCVPLALHAKNGETLRKYSTNGRFVYYRDRAITMQAGRFDLPAPGYVDEIRVMMQGSGTAMLHVFGNEAGMAAPFLRNDLIRPMTINKPGKGVETIAISFSQPMYIDDHQFYVAIDGLSDGLQLLSDDRLQGPSCVQGDVAYYSQLIRTSSGQWSWGRYGYAIDVDISYETSRSKPNLMDVTADARLTDSLSGNGSIAWQDFNRDGYLDLMVGGKLFKNSGNGTFSDATTASGLSGVPRGNLFIDMNNDQQPDILFLGDGAKATLFVNKGDGAFASRFIDLPGVSHPTSFSAADVDNDGYIDLFIGQNAGADSLAGGVLFLNDHHLGFLPERSAGHYGRSNGSQWLDYDNDGLSDLYVADARAGLGTIWRNQGNGTLAPVDLLVESVTGGSSPEHPLAGCSWGDYDNDGDLDLLLLKSLVAVSRAGAEGGRESLIYTNTPERVVPAGRVNEGFTSDVNRMGAVWADANNDGRLDFLTTTSCGCGGVDLYEQSAEGGFGRKSQEYGLFRVAGGVDAAWADYDNDGRLDLAMIVDGRLRLYRNQMSGSEMNSITLDLSKLGPESRDIGARVTLHVGDRHYTGEVASGRGLLMQDPLRLHFGIGAATVIDSATVRMGGGGGSATYTGLRVNSVNYLLPSGAAQITPSDGVALDAHPNPFSSELRITYRLPEEGRVSLTMYSLAGETVATLVDEQQPAGSHTVSWSARDAGGSSFPPGTYIYRLKTAGGEWQGRAVLTH